VNAIATVPRISIDIAGAPLAPSDCLALEEVVVQQRLSAPALCEVTFLCTARGEAEINVPLLGASLHLTIEGSASPLFTGDVTAVERVHHPSNERRIRVRAYDRLHRLQKRQPVRVHTQSGVRDIAEELVADLGLSVVGGMDGPRWARLIQYRQSDLDLLTEIAAHCGMYFILDADQLRLVTLEGAGAPHPLTVDDDLLEASFELNAATACRTVTTFGWDPSHISSYQGKVADTQVRRDRIADVAPVDVGGSGARALTNQTAPDAGHLACVAQAELDFGAAHEVVFRGVADGRSASGLRPGDRVRIDGAAAPFSTTYALTAVTHRVGRAHGYVVELSSAPPPRRRAAGGFLTVPAIVTRIDDPEGLGRISVTLPTMADLETDWLCVVAAGAGAGKGLMMLPDVDDHVIALVSENNPASGFVLGSVYGSRGMPDCGIEDGVVSRFALQTPGGLRVDLDDSRRRLKLVDATGSYVELAPAKTVLHSATDLLIEAPGHTIVVQAAAIDFRRA
jgi:phage baseplate assembly protein gpV/phage protein D